MKEEIKELKNKFNEIRKMGYVEGIGSVNNGVGLTFEKLLGKEIENFSFPDYNGIELKAKLEHSRKKVHLFTLVPDGESFFETKRLFEEYGFHYKGNGKKVLYGTVQSNKLCKIGNDYYFTLNTNYGNEKVELLIYNKDKKLIDNKTYWCFDSLKNVLERKLDYLALIKAWDNNINNKRYYKYFKMNIYHLKSFNNFLNLLENGKVSITFSVDTFKDGKRYGQIHDHGTSFSIEEYNLKYLFDEV